MSIIRPYYQAMELYYSSGTGDVKSTLNWCEQGKKGSNQAKDEEEKLSHTLNPFVLLGYEEIHAIVRRLLSVHIIKL